MVAPVVEEKDVYPTSDSGHAAERKLVRRLDFRLLPWITVCYLMSFLDRTAISNAYVFGMAKEIGASDGQYRLALLLFFIPYALGNTPSNILLKRFKPSVWLPMLMLGCGICQAMQGVVKSPQGLFAARFFLGLFESGQFPGAQFYLSSWYKRSEFAFRSAIFLGATTASGAFGALLAAGIAQMNGLGGLSGWRWIFIVEGILTFAAGLLSHFFIEDFPDNAKFLSLEERAMIISRLQRDAQFSAAGEDFDWKYVRAAFTDAKTYLGMIVFGCITLPVYAISLFLVVIVQNLGFKSATRTNLVTAPIFIVACLASVTTSYCSDRTGYRSYYNFAFLTFSAVGYAILIASRDFTLSYVGAYITATGVFCLVPNTIAWVAGNVEGAFKRATTVGVVIAWSNVNGAIASQVYWSNMKPWFRVGHIICLVWLGVAAAGNLALLLHLKRENRLRDQGRRDELIGGSPTTPADGIGRGGGWYRTVEDARREKGDRWSGFRYRL